MYDAARAALHQCEVLIITAGAGMGVDSGLPDFRGNEGFWRAYPPFAKLKLGFEDLANPRWFNDDPALAWGFYGHRLQLYRETIPHAGFAKLLEYSKWKRGGCRVFTSNVDGQFQKAGFPAEDVFEVHGSIHHLQCSRGCAGTWSNEHWKPQVDHDTMRAKGSFPTCKTCKAVARPNILMFGDFNFDPSRTIAQRAKYRAFVDSVRGKKIVVIECGAGSAIPTVRSHGEDLAASGATLIRLNPRETDVPRGQHGFAVGAKEGIEALLAAAS